MIKIFVNCRSVEIILSLLPFFTIKNDLDAEGLYCGVCEYTLKYDFSLGLTFGLEENLPASFSHLKESVKRHIQSSGHISAGVEKEKLTKDRERLYRQAKEAAVMRSFMRS